MSQFGARWYRGGVPLGVSEPVMVPSAVARGAAAIGLSALSVAAAGSVVEAAASGQSSIDLGALGVTGAGTVADNTPSTGSGAVGLGAVAVAAAGTVADTTLDPLLLIPQVELATAYNVWPPRFRIIMVGGLLPGEGLDVRWATTQANYDSGIWANASDPIIYPTSGQLAVGAIDIALDGVASPALTFFGAETRSGTTRSARSAAVLHGGIQPSLTSPLSLTVNEEAPLNAAMTADCANFTLTMLPKVADNDSDEFVFVGDNIRWSGTNSRDYESPADEGANNVYNPSFRLTNDDNGLYRDYLRFPIAVLNINDGPMTLDPNAKFPTAALSGGNLIFTSSGFDEGAEQLARGSKPISAALFHAEFIPDFTLASRSAVFGVMSGVFNPLVPDDPSNSPESISFLVTNVAYWELKFNGSTLASGSTAFDQAGDVGLFTGNRTLGKCWVGRMRGGTATYFNGDPEAGTGGADLPAFSPLYAFTGTRRDASVAVRLSGGFAACPPSYGAG